MLLVQWELQDSKPIYSVTKVEILREYSRSLKRNHQVNKFYFFAFNLFYYSFVNAKVMQSFFWIDIGSYVSLDNKNDL